MSRGKQKDEWYRFSSLMALLANINRDPEKTGVILPSVFNPFVNYKDDEQQKQQTNDTSNNKIKADINIFKEVFIDHCNAGGNSTHDVKK